MDTIPEFTNHLPARDRAAFQSLDTPRAVQEYLDSLTYIAEELDRSPLRVLADGQAHCLDGGMFAALALWRIGFRPLVLDLVPAPGSDDDHVLAVFQVGGRWGAIAKSNFVNLRYREPVYRNLRELAMSYFEHYHNLERQKTLRAYTRPLNLSVFKNTNWMWDEEGVKIVTRRLYGLKPVPLISEATAAQLSLVDERSFKGGTYGTDFDWVYGNR